MIAQKILGPRSEKKQKSLLTAAWQIFSESGYERTSMDAVVTLSGGSKATLYSYFKSKEELLQAALIYKIDELYKQFYEYEVNENDDLEKALYNFGIHYIDYFVNSDLLEVYRLMIAESNKFNIGVEVFKPWVEGIWSKVADALDERVPHELFLEGGKWTAAMQFKGLLEGEIFIYRLLGTINSLPINEIEVVAKNAVISFLKIYPYK